MTALVASFTTGTTGAGSNTISHVINLPSGIVAGNRLRVILSLDGASSANRSATWPAGWTEILDEDVAEIHATIGERFADGTEGATITVTSSHSERGTYRAERITGSHPSTPTAVSVIASGVSQDPDPPSLTVPWGAEENLWTASIFVDNGGTDRSAWPAAFATDQGYIKEGSGGGTMLAWGYRASSAATEDPVPFTISINEEWIAVTMAVRPLSGEWPSGYPSEVEADGPVHWYRMGEASGDVIDEVGGADGTIATETLTRNVTGLLAGAQDDGAIDFDNAHVLVTAAPALTDSWTVEMWLKPDTLTGHNFFGDDGAAVNSPRLLLVDVSNKVRLLWSDSTSAMRALDSASALSVATPYHVVATHDGTTARLYLNGVEDSSVATWDSKDYTGSSDLRIGDSSGGTQSFDGVIDEVALYDTALSAARVDAHYDAGVGTGYVAAVTADSPVAWWRMGEASGDVLDSVGFAHGTPIVGDPIRDATGLISAVDDDGAITFDGESRVDIAVKTALSGSFTLEAWIHPTDLSKQRGIVTRSPAMVVTSDGTLYLQTAPSSGQLTGITASAEDLIIQDETYHVVATYDGTTARLYIDGTQVASNNVVHTWGQTLREIGGLDSFIGTIDEFAEYDYALSAERVAVHYFAGINEITYVGISLFAAPAAEVSAAGVLLQQGSEFGTVEKLQVEGELVQTFAAVGAFAAPAAEFEGTGDTPFLTTFTGTSDYIAPIVVLEGTGTTPLLTHTGVGDFIAPMVVLEGGVHWDGIGDFLIHGARFDLGVGAIGPLYDAGVLYDSGITYGGMLYDADVEYDADVLYDGTESSAGSLGALRFLGVGDYAAPAAELTAESAIDFLFTGVGAFTAPPVEFNISSFTPDITVPVFAIEIDWDGSGFVPLEGARRLDWTRGADADLGWQKPGSGTISLSNEDNIYTDTNPASPLLGLIRPGARVWAHVTVHGSTYGIWSGYLADLAPTPQDFGAQMVTDDLLTHLSTVDVAITVTVGTTWRDYRRNILLAAGVPSTEMALAPEDDVIRVPALLGVGKALDLLEEINEATGTRHFMRTGGIESIWQQYVTVNRWRVQEPFTVLTGDEIDRTSFGGWRSAWETIVNYQQVAVNGDITFSDERETVWEVTNLPISLAANETRTMWASGIGPFTGGFLDGVQTGLSVVGLTFFAESAKIDLTAGSSGALITSMFITGLRGTRDNDSIMVAEDTASQAIYRFREGVGRSAEGLTETQAQGLADHLVWRFGEARKQPSTTQINEIDQVVGRLLFDVVELTASEVFAEDRRMEIIGQSGSITEGIMEVTWQLQDVPEQTPDPNWAWSQTSSTQQGHYPQH